MKRNAWLWGGLAGLLAAGLMALITSVVDSHDSTVAERLNANTLAVVGKVVGLDYAYSFGACYGLGTRNPPPAIGAQVRIFYDPTNPCQGLDYDPVARQRSDLTGLGLFSAVFSLAVGSAAWDFARWP